MQERTGTWARRGNGTATGADIATPPALSRLFAGGFFYAAGGVPANSAARWTDQGGSALRSGIGGEVYAMQMYDDDGLGPGPPVL
jgi:2-keto-3-deoxy-6-phosphogluconate aldolase